MVSTIEWSFQQLAAASDLFRLLSLILYLPTQEIVEGILTGSLAEDVLAILDELGFPEEELERFKAKFFNIQSQGLNNAELLSGMRREYTRLFTHPLEPKIGICEALFNNRGDSRGKRPILFVSPSALSAEHCYQKAGLIMTNAVNEPGDHMAIEMEFMMYLFSEKAKALHFNNQEKLLKIDKGINEFSEKHLKKWAVSFFENCASLSNNEFYRIFGEAGSIFLTKVLNSQM